MITEEDLQWAWFAGLFEGEGHIALIGSNSVELKLISTDLDVLLRVLDLCGGSILDVKERPGRKTAWTWRMAKKEEVQKVLGRILPYLGERRGGVADIALERLKGNRGYGYKVKK